MFTKKKKHRIKKYKKKKKNGRDDYALRKKLGGDILGHGIQHKEAARTQRRQKLHTSLIKQHEKGVEL